MNRIYDNPSLNFIASEQRIPIPAGMAIYKDGNRVWHWAVGAGAIPGAYSGPNRLMWTACGSQDIRAGHAQIMYREPCEQNTEVDCEPCEEIRTSESTCKQCGNKTDGTRICRMHG